MAKKNFCRPICSASFNYNSPNERRNPSDPKFTLKNKNKKLRRISKRSKRKKKDRKLVHLSCQKCDGNQTWRGKPSNISLNDIFFHFCLFKTHLVIIQIEKERDAVLAFIYIYICIYVYVYYKYINELSRGRRT